MPKVSEINTITGAQLANADKLYIVDVGSPNQGRAIEADQLAQGSQFSSRFVPKSGDRMFIGAGSMFATLGSPTVGRTSVVYDTGGWALDASSNEGVGFNFVPPTHWATYNAIIWWTNDGAGSGDVRWNYRYAYYNAGDSISSGQIAAEATATAGLDDVVVNTTIATGITNVPGELVVALIYRLGNTAPDTLANDCALLGIELVRAS